ncbi:nucleoside deaminase [Candidatus Woesearchaeota archaeon]|nr:nucleoside deaminase [Candidatus Woesearchaeota archaeon]
MVNKFMKKAVEEASKGLKSNSGGPFGAVIVKDDKIIAKAHNQVLKSNDPTSHAEIVAIRKASAKLKRFDLSDCEIYSSCEPCPMCFSAIHWARIKKVYYGCTKEDAENIGFDDKFVYDAIKGKAKKEHVKKVQIDRHECLKPFKEWGSKKDKKRY